MAAFTIASAASMAPTRPLVSTIPSASIDIGIASTCVRDYRECAAVSYSIAASRAVARAAVVELTPRDVPVSFTGLLTLTAAQAAG